MVEERADRPDKMPSTIRGMEIRRDSAERTEALSDDVAMMAAVQRIRRQG